MKRSVLDSIERILRTAHNENRYNLFEHEVYEILAKLGVRTPTHIFISDEKNITADTLSLFSSDKIVLKAAAKGITHKQKSGGVKIIYKDLDFVKHSFNKMRTIIENSGAEVSGILLAEYIEYSKNLGNEILLGFRESEAFGPVISFTKGGTDAEHFAKNFSPPNLILAPIDRQWALALLESTRIQKKYIDEGNTGYITKIVDVGVVFSDLAIHFSNFFPGKSRYAMKEFEVNPFIFDYQGNFIAIDGFAKFELKADKKPDLDILPKQTLTPFFEPESIAVIGISASDNTKSGNIIVKNLINMNRKNIYAINIKGGSVVIAQKRFKLHRSILDIKSPIDLAIITVPAESTISIVEDCAKKRVKTIILISGGFSEVRKNQEIEKKILEICKKNSIRVMGPNCLGIVYAGDKRSGGMNTFFIPEKKFSVNLEKKDRNVAILSQSGALGITEIYNLRNAIAPKVIVSYGNQLDIDPSDLANYFEDDPSVDVIGFYIEGFKSGAGRKFFNITQKSTKPIIVYKAGRTEAGKLAAQSHTASIAGEYAICKAAMKQAGLVVADTMLDHGDFIKTFALLHDFNVSGNRVAIITNAGYEKTYAADNIGDLEIATLDRATKQSLEKILPSFVNADSLLDLTAMASDELFERCIEIFLSSKTTDALFISIVPQAQVIHTTDEEIDKYEMNIAARIINIVHKYKKPTVVSINVVSGADAVYNKLGQVLDLGRVPTFLTAERAMVCLNEFIKYKTTKDTKAYSEWLR